MNKIGILWGFYNIDIVYRSSVQCSYLLGFPVRLFIKGANMTATRRKLYVEMTDAEIATSLAKKKFSDEEKELFKARIVDERAALRNNVRRKKELDKHWEPILNALVREMISAGSSIGYHVVGTLIDGERQARKIAFDKYMFMLQTLNTGLRELKAAGILPAQYATEKKLPFNGTHWSDFVSETAKNQILHYFYAIPYRPRVKRKELFVRRVPAGAWKKNAQDLFEAMDRELAAIDRELSLIHTAWDPTHREEGAEQVLLNNKQKLLFAKGILMGLSNNTALPRTWHGLFTINKEFNK